MSDANNGLSFWEYQLTTRAGNGTDNRHGAICLGERIKKGTYRSTITTIPYSQITGALRAALPLEKSKLANIHAVGKFVNPELLLEQRATVSMSIRQRVSGAAQIPIDTTVLVNAQGMVFVEINETTQDWDKTRSLIVVKMGAYRNKGLGRCHLNWTRRIDFQPSAATRGHLTTRIPEDQLARFGISHVEKPIYGYLFQPDTSYTSGKYVRSLFEKSIVIGPRFLLG